MYRPPEGDPDRPGRDDREVCDTCRNRRDTVFLTATGTFYLCTVHDRLVPINFICPDFAPRD